jgi:hypothetical protein
VADFTALVAQHCAVLHGNLSITDVAGLTTLAGLQLAEVTGFVFIEANAQLSSLDGLQQLSSVGGELDINFDPKLLDLSGLSQLTHIGGAFSIVANGLTSLNGLEQLKTVGGVFGISSNGALTSLSGLEHVTSVGLTLVIDGNPKLTSLAPLHGWPADALKADLAVHDNVELPQCDVDSFDAQQTGALTACSNCSGNDAAGTCL